MHTRSTYVTTARVAANAKTVWRTRDARGGTPAIGLTAVGFTGRGFNVTEGWQVQWLAASSLELVIAVGGNGAQALVLADEWMTHLIGELKRAESTVRGCQGAIRTFCDYTASPHYQWPAECEARFGTHPVRASW